MPLICLITGSSRGIGLDIAKSLARQGNQVILNSRKPISDDVLKQFETYDHPVAQAIGDISNFDTAKKVIDEVIEHFGRIDVLINNAGITNDMLAMRMKEDAFDEVINTNLKGTFNTCRHVIKPMLKQRGGTIINMSSVSGILGNAGQVNYSASKAGVIGLTKSLARELGSRHITVNAIAPGYIETEMTDVLSDKIKKQMLAQIPLNRFGNTEEIAQAVDFLIQNRYITGQVINVDGGLSM